MAKDDMTGKREVLVEEGSVTALVDAKKERELVRKLDMYIIPVYFVTYMVSFLDRANIGNANIAGMSEDLGLHGSQFNVAVSIFYITYIIFEIPLTVLLKMVGPSKLIPIITIGWSLVTAFSGFTQSYGGLVTCRLILGIFESALFPALNLYVSMFWRREEIAKRASMIFIAMAMAGAFGGLFAYAITQMNGIGGKEGWRWLFFIEGILSFVVGLLGFFLYPDNPEIAYFLNKEERQLGRLRLERYGNYEPYDIGQVKSALVSPTCWLSGLLQMCSDTYVYSMVTFLPAIIKGIGYTSLQAQYLTVPVYVLGASGFFFAAYFSDRLQRRAPIMLFFGLFTLCGYAILLGSRTPGVLYFACYMVVFAGYVFPGLNITWINGNTQPHYKRATAIAMNQTIGNIGGVIAGQIYLSKEAPYYTTGHAVSLTGCGLAWLGTLAMWYILSRQNAVKEKKLQDGVLDTGKGDESLDFKYQL